MRSAHFQEGKCGAYLPHCSNIRIRSALVKSVSVPFDEKNSHISVNEKLHYVKTCIFRPFASAEFALEAPTFPFAALVFAKVAVEFAKVGAANAFGGLFLHYLRRSRVSKYPSNAKSTATFAKVAVVFAKVMVDFGKVTVVFGKVAPGNAKYTQPNANSV